MAVQARGTTKSPLDAERRDRRPEQAKELQKIRRRVTKNTMPDNRGDPIEDALLNWEPVEYIPHVVCDMAKPRHTANRFCSFILRTYIAPLKETTQMRSQPRLKKKPIFSNNRITAIKSRTRVQHHFFWPWLCYGAIEIVYLLLLLLLLLLLSL